MPDFNELEVFHKILHEAELAQKPPHECESYLQLTTEERKQIDVLYLLWNKSETTKLSDNFNAQSAFEKFKLAIENETNESVNQAENTPKIISLTSSRWQQNWLRYAAVFILVLSASYFFISRPDTFEGGQSGLYVHMEDGSHVWLQQGATLKVKKLWRQKRDVILHGAAFFQINSDINNPFAISVNGLDISVPGTVFLVDGDKLQVEVYEGLVKVATGKKAIQLHEKEKLALVNGNLITDVSTGEKPDWVNPILSFDNAPLEIVIRDLEAFFGVTITVDGEKETSECPFTSGSLAQTSFEDILTTLKLTFEMNIEKTGNTAYTFSEISCK